MTREIVNGAGRRRFLKSALGAAAASVPWIAPGGLAAAKSGERIKVGQIGIGHNHAAAKMAAFRKLADAYEVVGIVEPDPAWRAKRGSDPAYRDLPWMTEEQLFDVPGLRAVAVETDVPDLTAAAMRCLRAGLHIHMDKPGDESLARFGEMLDEAGKRRLAVQLGYMFRANPAMRFCIRAVREGLLGQVFSVHAEMSRYQPPAYHEWLAGFRGGNFHIFGCHLIDLVVSMLGEPERITPFMSRSRPGSKTVDHGVAVMEYPRTIATARAAALEVEGEKRRHLAVCGDRGTIEIRPLEDPTVLTLTLREDRPPHRKGRQTVDFPAMSGRYDDQLLELARVIRGEIPNPYPLDHERLVQKCLLQACGCPID